MIEASLVVAMMSLLLFGVMQVSRIYAAREIMDYAAMNGARAKAVGLNEFMVHKVVRVSAIPNAGRMLTPDVDAIADGAIDWTTGRPGDLWDAALEAQVAGSPRSVLERQLVPFYLSAENHGMLPAILQYEDWSTVHAVSDLPSLYEVRVQAVQRYPIRFPMSGTFIGSDDIILRGGGHGARMANHASLYLE